MILLDTLKEARKQIRPLRGKGKTPGMHRRIANLQKGTYKGRKTKTPLLDGIQKNAVSKPVLVLGGLGAGIFGVPYLKKKYIGVHPETLQRYEQGDPNYDIQSPRMPFNPYLSRPDIRR